MLRFDPLLVESSAVVGFTSRLKNGNLLLPMLRPFAISNLLRLMQDADSVADGLKGVFRVLLFQLLHK